MKDKKVLSQDTQGFSHASKTLHYVPKGTEIRGLVWTGIDYRWRAYGKSHAEAGELYSSPYKPKYIVHEPENH